MSSPSPLRPEPSASPPGLSVPATPGIDVEGVSELRGYQGYTQTMKFLGFSTPSS